MSDQFFEKPILNSPYEYPNAHWALDESGQPTQKVVNARRRAEFITPIPKPRKRKGPVEQAQMDLGTAIGPEGDSQRYDPTPIINQLRSHVDAWRELKNPNDWLVTPETARLLQHWRYHSFNEIRPFFCQIEAVEVAIWLTEVAPKMGKTGKIFLNHLDSVNNDANPELMRLALKLATGAGKTTVMAMIIAWQTINSVRRSNSKKYSRGFLIVAPGLTIKDRLRVLLPNDLDSYYASRELVPRDMLPDLEKAKIVITNYHAFKLRERIEISKGGRSLLQGRGEALNTLETEGQMLQRVMPALMGLKNIMVINDEAHHCYREKPEAAEDNDLKGDDKKEAEKNSEAARLWISGLEAVNRKLGVSRVIDLSATPFFLQGSGYAEGTLFPWTMSDFSLMDAIECGIVKLPRVPIADNIPGGEMPKFRNLWDHIRTKMPKKGRGKAKNIDPLKLPLELITALDALYGHYKKTFDLWQASGIKVPPCFIVVCNNTATSKLVYDYISGFFQTDADGNTQLVDGRLELFRNFDANGERYARPNTLLIDSEQLESGEALDKNFREMAADELERYRKEVIERTGDIKQAESITDQELLREVMNTVGKEGRLGETVRCVVSVSMLTEGWDTNTVTHVLGVRAFGTQLLCEQVIGRALRRQSYTLNDEGKFDVEYADVLGIPFHITREPEQVKAFRDTWRDGIHSYLTYLRDRLTVARDLLTESGSIFVQIGDENIHRVRVLLDEIFGSDNFVVLIGFQKTGGLAGNFIESTQDYLIWYCKNKSQAKFRQLYAFRQPGEKSLERYDQHETIAFHPDSVSKAQNDVETFRRYQAAPLFSDGGSPNIDRDLEFQGSTYTIRKGTHWKTKPIGLKRLALANRIISTGKTVRYKRFVGDFPVIPVTDRWDSMQIGIGLNYVVETSPKVIERCILMASDPGDLVLDPTCGSGTTAYVAEQWGRRWITIDTSRVSLALARARIMGARYPYYLLADTYEGQQKEAEITRTTPSSAPTYGRISQGFVYQRVPHITLKSIANNAEIDVIWERFQPELEALRAKLNKLLGTNFEEWEVPRPPGDLWPDALVKLHATILSADTDKKKLTALKKLNTALKRNYTLQDLPESPCDDWDNEEAIEIHRQWWALRIARQQEIDASIAARAEQEYLYDKPYEDKKKVRVAGPFTVESLSPHRALGLDENDELIDPMADRGDEFADTQDFTHIILENLKIAGVQQAHKTDKINFTAIRPWPGHFICAEGRYQEGGEASGLERRAAIFIGPEFGTVSRPDLVTAAREAGDADFDVLISCAFNYEAHATEFNKLGRIPVLKARMNADLHMAEDLKNTDKANLFVIFGEPDIDIIETDDQQIQVKVNGVDVFHPNTGEVRSDNADGIACWFVDTDYNEESFFVRQAYFLGANDPYKALKNTLKAEINEEAWQSLYGDISRPFDRPTSGRIAVKVINHLGDEVMKVFGV